MEIELPEIDLPDFNPNLDDYNVLGDVGDIDYVDVDQVSTPGRSAFESFTKGSLDATLAPQILQADRDTPEQRKIRLLQEQAKVREDTAGNVAANFAGELSTQAIPFMGLAKAGSAVTRAAFSEGKALLNRGAIAKNTASMNRLKNPIGPREIGPTGTLDNANRINALSKANNRLGTYNPSGSVLKEGLAQEVLATPAGVGYDYARNEITNAADDTKRKFNALESFSANFLGGMALGTPLAYATSGKARAANKAIQDEFSFVSKAIKKDRKLNLDGEFMSNKIENGDATVTTTSEGKFFTLGESFRVPLETNKNGIERFKPNDMQVAHPETGEWMSLADAKKQGFVDDDGILAVSHAISDQYSGKKDKQTTNPDISKMTDEQLQFMDDEVVSLREVQDAQALHDAAKVKVDTAAKEVEAGANPADVYAKYGKDIDAYKQALEELDDLTMKYEKQNKGADTSVDENGRPRGDGDSMAADIDRAGQTQTPEYTKFRNGANNRINQVVKNFANKKITNNRGDVASPIDDLIKPIADSYRGKPGAKQAIELEKQNAADHVREYTKDRALNDKQIEDIINDADLTKKETNRLVNDRIKEIAADGINDYRQNVMGDASGVDAPKPGSKLDAESEKVLNQAESKADTELASGTESSIVPPKDLASELKEANKAAKALDLTSDIKPEGKSIKALKKAHKKLNEQLDNAEDYLIDAKSDRQQALMTNNKEFNHSANDGRIKALNEQITDLKAGIKKAEDIFDKITNKYDLPERVEGDTEAAFVKARGKKPVVKQKQDEVTGETITEDFTQAEKTATVKADIIKNLDEGKSYKRSYDEIESLANRDKRFGKFYNDIETANQYRSTTLAEILNGRQVDAPEGTGPKRSYEQKQIDEIVERGRKALEEEGELVVSTTGDTLPIRKVYTELNKLGADGKRINDKPLFKIDNDTLKKDTDRVIIDEAAVDSALKELGYAERNVEGKVDEVNLNKQAAQKSMREAVIKALHRDAVKLIKSKGIAEASDVMSRMYQNISKGEFENISSAAQTKFFNFKVADDGYGAAVGVRDMFVPSTDIYTGTNKGGLTYQSINDLTNMPSIAERLGGKRGAIDMDGNIYLNNQGKVNNGNMRTVLHELAHQHLNAVGSNKLSKNEAYMTNLADAALYTLSRKNKGLLERAGIDTSKLTKPDGELKPGDVEKFESYIVNSLNNPDSGLSKWFNKTKGVEIASMPKKDVIKGVNDILGSKFEMYKSVDDFVADYIHKSPTLYNMFASDDKRLNSILASSTLKTKEKVILEKEAALRSKFEESIGKLSDEQANMMGEFINAGGHKLLSFMEVGDIADFLRGKGEYGKQFFSKDSAGKGFKESADNQMLDSIFNTLSPKIKEQLLADVQPRLDELNKIAKDNVIGEQKTGIEGTKPERIEQAEKNDGLVEDVVTESKTKGADANKEIAEIRAGIDETVNSIKREIKDYLKEKSFIEAEANNIAKENFSRQGRSQVTGKRKLYSSMSSKSFSKNISDIINNNLSGKSTVEPSLVRESIQDIPNAVEDALHRQIEGMVMAKRLNGIRQSADDIGAIIQGNDKGIDTLLRSWSAIEKQMADEGISTRQFGFNPINTKSLHDKPMKIVGKQVKVSAEDLVATLGNGSKIVVDSQNATLGKQSPLLISPSKMDSMTVTTDNLKVTGSGDDAKVHFINEQGVQDFIGYAKDLNIKANKNGSHTINIKNEQLAGAQKGFSYNAVDAYMNNVRALLFNRIGREANNEFVATLKKSGILRPESDGGRGFEGPSFSHEGVRYAVDKRFAHNIFGTKGIEIQNKYIKSVVNSAQGIISSVKGKILTTRLASYVNSLIANNITLGLTTKMGILDVMASNDKALRDLNGFSKVAASDGMRAARKKYPDVYDFMYKTSGNESLMRDAVRNNSKVAPNRFMSEFMSGNNQLAQDLASTNLEAGSSAGDNLATLFDNTEIKQKLGFYRHFKKQGMSDADIMANMHTAFPSYAENLTDVMSLVDEIVLFTKYMTNIPKITRYALNKNTSGMIGMFAGMIAANEALYELMPEDPADGYMKEYGMTKVAPNTYMNMSSKNNYNLSSLGEVGVVNADSIGTYSTPLGASPKVFSFGAKD